MPTDAVSVTAPCETGLGQAIARHGRQPLRSLSWWAISHPLARPLRHASADAATLESIVVAADIGGTVGFAEVRANGAYATGEDGRLIESALSAVALGVSVEETTEALLPISHLAAMAIDIAAWDALGHREATPLYRLLGGEETFGVETHAQIGFGDVPEAAALAARFVGEGFRRVKVRVGSSDPTLDIRRLRAIRKVVGAEVVVTADANAGWSLEQAQSVMASFADLAVTWIEQPVASSAQLRILSEQNFIPIRADESVRGDASIRELGEKRAVHGVHLKLEKSGTVARLVSSIAQARAAGFDVALGQMDQGRLGCAATTHLAAGLGFRSAELWGCAEILDDIAGPLTIDRGTVLVPQGPGLGVQVTVPTTPKGAR